MEKPPSFESPASFESASERKEQALAKVIDAFYEKIEQFTDETFESSGREYSVDKVADCMVANVQAAVAAAESVLEEVRGTDYFTEKAAAQLAATMQAKEAYLRNLAGLEAEYPTGANRLGAQDPVAHAAKIAAEERIAEMKKAA